MSDFFSAKGARDSLTRAQYQVGPVVETPSLAEAFWMDYETQIAEFNTNSEVDAERRFNHDENAEIRDMIDRGEIPPDVVEDARKVIGYTSEFDEEVTGLNFAKLKRWANENIEGAVFDKDDETMKAVMRKEREYRSNKMDSADFWGKAYGMAGSIWGMTDDPVSLMVAFTPFGGVKNANTVVGAAARAALREGAIGMAAEIPLQVKAYEFSKRIESGYTTGDAFMNVALAGLLSGVIGGGIDAGRHVVSRPRTTSVAEQMANNQTIIDQFEAKGTVKGDEKAVVELLKDQNRTLSGFDPDADARAVLEEADTAAARATEEPVNASDDVTEVVESEADAAVEPEAKPRMRVVAEVGEEIEAAGTPDAELPKPEITGTSVTIRRIAENPDNGVASYHTEGTKGIDRQHVVVFHNRADDAGSTTLIADSVKEVKARLAEYTPENFAELAGGAQGAAVTRYADDLPDYDEALPGVQIDEEGNLSLGSIDDSLSAFDQEFEAELKRLDDFVDCVNG